MQSQPISVDSIEIGERHRALSEDAVERLAASMKAIGLRSPITVRVVDDYVSLDGEVSDGVPVLVAGAHRLAAAKALGWTHIDCIDADDDPISAELWEIAENLHRLDLTTEQRNEHIRRYAELLETKAAAKVVHGDTLSAPTTGRGNKGIARQVADATGLSKSVVKRALNPKQPKRRVIEVPDQLDHDDMIELQVRAVMTAWNKACPEARAIIMERIDVPVLDREFA